MNTRPRIGYVLGLLSFLVLFAVVGIVSIRHRPGGSALTAAVGNVSTAQLNAQFDFTNPAYVPATNRNGGNTAGANSKNNGDQASNAFSDAQIQTIAQNVGIFDLPKFYNHWNLQSQFDTMKKIVDAGNALGNPIKTYLYYNSTFWFSNNFNDAAGNGWGTYADQFNTDWYLKDINGNYVTSNDKDNDYVLDLTNPAYQQYAIATTTDWAKKNPQIGGIKFDSSKILDGGGITGSVDHRINFQKRTWNQILCVPGAPTDAKGNCDKVNQWNAGLQTIIGTVRTNLHALGMTVSFNGVAPTDSAGDDRNIGMFPYADNAQDEAFCYGLNNNNPGTTNFKPLIDDITMMKTWAASGKGIREITSTNGDPTAATYAHYCLAGFLMGWQPGYDYWIYQSNYNDPLTNGYPEVLEQNLALGLPTAQYKQSGDILSRTFQNGFVAVNTSTSSTETIPVPASMVEFKNGVQGTTYSTGSTVSLAPQEGRLFLYMSYLSPVADTLPNDAKKTLFSIGVSIADGVTFNNPAKVPVIQSLHATASRMQVSSLTDAGKAMNTEATTYHNAGLGVFLNIYNKDSKNGATHTNPNGKTKPVSSPPTDLALYKTQVGQLLDTYKPVFVTIENEENGSYYSGTPQQYVTELNAAAEVAHQKGYKVSTGGDTGVPIALMVWKNYWDQGLYSEADAFAKEAFGPQTKAANIYALLPTQSDPNKTFPPKANAVGYNWAAEEVPLLKNSSVDYVNFHWYLENADAFKQAAEYLQHATGKQVISNEVGQNEIDNGTVPIALMQIAIDSHMAYFNWFSNDDTSGGDAGQDEVATKALQNGDGSLRTNGVAVAKFLGSYNGLIDNTQGGGGGSTGGGTTTGGGGGGSIGGAGGTIYTDPSTPTTITQQSNQPLDKPVSKTIQFTVTQKVSTPPPPIKPSSTPPAGSPFIITSIDYFLDEVSVHTTTSFPDTWTLDTTTLTNDWHTLSSTYHYQNGSTRQNISIFKVENGIPITMKVTTFFTSLWQGIIAFFGGIFH